MLAQPARELRRAVAHPRRCDDVACLGIVERCPPELIDAGNVNHKTALMLAAQFRPTPAVVEALLARGADVDATTRRGHSALARTRAALSPRRASTEAARKWPPLVGSRVVNYGTQRRVLGGR